MVETSAEVLPALPQFSESKEGGEQKQRYFGGFQSRCSSTSDACRYHVIEIDGPMGNPWGDRRVKSQDWRPERNVIVIAGRPVCVLMVSHQGAKALEWDSYHNLIFGPLRPVVLLGPTGHSAQAPKMQPKFSVIEWWKVFVFSGLWEPTLHEKMARLLLFLPRPLRLPRPYPHLPTPPRPTPPSRPHTLSRRRLCSLEIPVFLTRDYATTITRKLACRT